MWRKTFPDDELAKQSLARYFAIVQNKKTAKFLKAKKVAVEFDGHDSFEALWKQHDHCTQEYLNIERQIDGGIIDFNDVPLPEKSYLDLKIKIAEKMLECCHFCSRRCDVNRLAED